MWSPQAESPRIGLTHTVGAAHMRLSRFIWKYPQNLANPVLR
jgi:hypothetical protein